MIEYTYQINDYRGTGSLSEINRINVELNNEVIDTALLRMNVPVGDRMFFKGYQTWTWSVEYEANDRMRGLRRLPSRLIRQYEFDR